MQLSPKQKHSRQAEANRSQTQDSGVRGPCSNSRSIKGPPSFRHTHVPIPIYVPIHSPSPFPLPFFLWPAAPLVSSRSNRHKQIAGLNPTFIYPLKLFSLCHYTRRKISPGLAFSGDGLPESRIHRLSEEAQQEKALFVGGHDQLCARAEYIICLPKYTIRFPPGFMQARAGLTEGVERRKRRRRPKGCCFCVWLSSVPSSCRTSES